MENVKTITLKKSVLAQYKGLGLTTTEMATRIGITAKEVNEALFYFELKKGKKPTPPAYVIQYEDDITQSLDDNPPTDTSENEVAEEWNEDDQELVETL